MSPTAPLLLSIPSIEDSIIATPTPDRSRPSPAPEINPDIGTIHKIGCFNTEEKRKREDEIIDDLKTIDATSNLPPTNERKD